MNLPPPTTVERVAPENAHPFQQPQCRLCDRGWRRWACGTLGPIELEETSSGSKVVPQRPSKSVAQATKLNNEIRN